MMVGLGSIVVGHDQKGWLLEEPGEERLDVW